MIVRPQQHWLRRIFVWHGSSIIQDIIALTTQFSLFIAVIFMLPWYTHLGIKFTLAPFSILGVAIAIFLVFVIMPGTPVTLKRENFGGS